MNTMISDKMRTQGNIYVTIIKSRDLRGSLFSKVGSKNMICVLFNKLFNIIQTLIQNYFEFRLLYYDRILMILTHTIDNNEVLKLMKVKVERLKVKIKYAIV